MGLKPMKVVRGRILIAKNISSPEHITKVDTSKEAVSSGGFNSSIFNPGIKAVGPAIGNMEGNIGDSRLFTWKIHHVSMSKGVVVDEIQIANKLFFIEGLPRINFNLVE